MRRKGKAAKAENHERWLITYADLITLLLVFFIVLYAGSQDDSKKFAILAQGLRSAFHNVADNGAGGSSAVFVGSGTTSSAGSAQELQDFKRLETVLEQFAEQNGLGQQISLRVDSDGIAVILTGDLLFSPGDAQVRPSALPTLVTLARALQDLPNAVRVEGHTDDVPANSPVFASNWELSTARATAIVRWLVDQGHLPASRLFAAGYADTHPLANNTMPEGRRANRRAEVVVLYPASGGPTPTAEAAR